MAYLIITYSDSLELTGDDDETRLWSLDDASIAMANSNSILADQLSPATTRQYSLSVGLRTVLVAFRADDVAGLVVA
ncbi:uncharacterized protein N7443_002530 [Penicillium atrosanguineum]|uniref:uncharacterized protein n=1 Tax=Penicillium atrosanguineum TaxID=1132637 RepID=UPI0023909C1B|nr:uncharacterized protein N7443_002530 [Penicillium atrosanguineum]KAJ5122426.1 hypothetical protein N7526_009363 [Penicillium atrosanguineum]KAJ5310069.1 hypothetical protein N7443_002530 [Penicillium atrosanguineum]